MTGIELPYYFGTNSHIITASNATIARQPNSANISQNNSEEVPAHCGVDINFLSHSTFVRQ
jgi:hypothetical protein